MIRCMFACVRVKKFFPTNVSISTAEFILSIVRLAMSTVFPLLLCLDYFLQNHNRWKDYADGHMITKFISSLGIESSTLVEPILLLLLVN